MSNSIERPSKNAFSILSSPLPPLSVRLMLLIYIFFNAPKDNYHYSATTLYKFRRVFVPQIRCMYTFRSAAFSDTSDSNSGRFYFPWNYIVVFSCFLIVYKIKKNLLRPAVFQFFLLFVWFLPFLAISFRPVEPFKGPFEIRYKSKIAGFVLLQSFTRLKVYALPRHLDVPDWRCRTVELSYCPRI